MGVVTDGVDAYSLHRLINIYTTLLAEGDASWVATADNVVGGSCAE